MSANCHATTSASSRCHARRGRTRVPRARLDLDETLRLQDLDGLTDDGAAHAELGRQFVLVGQWCTARPRTRDDAQAEIADDPAV
jgi:hypothetical protein